MSQLPELDFAGVEKLDFVVTRDREETAEVTFRYKPVMASSICLNLQIEVFYNQAYLLLAASEVRPRSILPNPSMRSVGHVASVDTG
jgi:hypothetical protein